MRPLALAMFLTACQQHPVANGGQPIAPAPAIEQLRVDWQVLTYPATRECGIVRSANWSARLISAPGAPSRLNVSGTVSTKPTTTLTLRLDPRVRESFPVQRSIFLDSAMPSEPTPDIAEGRTLRGEWAIDGRPGIVTIHCGRTILGTVRDEAALP